MDLKPYQTDTQQTMHKIKFDSDISVVDYFYCGKSFNKIVLLTSIIKENSKSIASWTIDNTQEHTEGINLKI